VGGSTPVRIERCEPLAHRNEIEALFLRNGRESFPVTLARAYGYARTGGGVTWIARNAEGSVVGHLAALPRLFRDPTRAARAALFADMLMDRGYRDFRSAVQLCRQAVADLRSVGSFDFAYTDPTLPAQVVVRAAGFMEVGTMRRYVVPLHPLYTLFFRLGEPAERLFAERVEGDGGVRVADALHALAPGPYFRGERSPELYATRLGGETMPQWEWHLLHRGLDPQSPVAALVLVARSSSGRVPSIVDLLWDERQVSASAVLRAVVGSMWDAGFSRLGMVTLAESGLARALRRCGFIRRGDALPLFVLQLREGVRLPPPGDWLLTYFDGSAW